MEAFKEYGPVAEAAVVFDKNTGRNKGFGFVTFEQASSCYRALANPVCMINVSIRYN